jgi:hypothetical protein
VKRNRFCFELVLASRKYMVYVTKYIGLRHVVHCYTSLMFIVKYHLDVGNRDFVHIFLKLGAFFRKFVTSVSNKCEGGAGSGAEDRPAFKFPKSINNLARFPLPLFGGISTHTSRKLSFNRRN